MLPAGPRTTTCTSSRRLASIGKPSTTLPTALPRQSVAPERQPGRGPGADELGRALQRKREPVAARLQRQCRCRRLSQRRPRDDRSALRAGRRHRYWCDRLVPRARRVAAQQFLVAEFGQQRPCAGALRGPPRCRLWARLLCGRLRARQCWRHVAKPQHAARGITRRSNWSWRHPRGKPRDHW